jgi:hypothetical protein
MWETIIVWAIVGSVGGLALRSLYRTLTGKEKGCACSGQAECPLSQPCGPARGSSVEPDKASPSESRSDRDATSP